MKTALRILIVEDDKYFLAHLREILSVFGPVECAMDWLTAQKLLKLNVYDVVVTDIHLEENPDGMKVLDEARRLGAMRLVLTSSDSEAVITEAYARGAQHVLGKEHAHETVPAYLKGLLHHRHQDQLQGVFETRFPLSNVNLRNQISNLLTTPWQGRSLLLTGPTGTGKSLLGKLLSELVFGAEAPFVHINCSEIPDNLLESELFGHEKGSFTGAEQRRVGKLKLADGGVLFLDEVGTMSQAMQQKLLKAIEEKTFYPVGSNKQESSRFTLITATCEDLQKKITQGSFREDLFFRLNGFQIRLPSLRERRDDIELLVRYFQNLNTRKFVIQPIAMEKLIAHAWDGNIRELKQVVMNLADGDSGLVGLKEVEAVLQSSSSSPLLTSGLINDEIRNFIMENGLREYFQHVERQITEESLKRHQGKITSCIKELKISSSAFYRILQTQNIND